MPAWSSLHPILIHGPVALLPTAALFVFLSAALRERFRSFAEAALILMALGTLGAFAAVSSGDAAKELVDRTPEVVAVLDRHAGMAESLPWIFLVLTGLQAALLYWPGAWRARLSGVALRSWQGGFLALYALALGWLTFTAHQGGLLVHRLGVRAMF